MRRNLLLLGIFVVSMLCLVGCGKTKINLNDYLETNVSGYDTVGKATYLIDYDSIINDNAEVFKVTEDDLEWLGLYMELESKISGDYNNASNLSNGDKIRFMWNVRAAAIEEAYSIEFVHTPVEIEVSELQEAKKINPFELVEYSFEGSAPYGKITFTNYISEYGVNVVADKTQGLANGDVVTLSIKANNGGLYESFFKKGVVPTEVTKKIVVSGLESYFTTIDSLTECLDTFHEDALETFETISMHDWIEKDSFKGLEYVGSYLIDGSKSYNWKSLLFNIYTVDITNSEGTFQYFYYKYYKNAKITIEGNVEYETSNSYIPTFSLGWFPSGEYFQKGSYYYAGYETLNEFYEEQIYQYIKNDYVCVTNITEDTFAKSAEIFEANRFDTAKWLWRNGEFEKAKEVLLDCGDERYADEKILEVRYELAEESVQAEDYGTAYKLWTELESFRDAEKRAEDIVGNVFEQAKISWKKGKYHLAYDLVCSLPDLSVEQEAESEQIVAAYLYEQFVNAEVGDTVSFGKYKPYNETKEKLLEWLVLEKHDEGIMLLCKQAVERMAFDESGKRTYWSESDLREWLNGEFLATAFDSDENDQIILSQITVEGQSYSEGYGLDTQDYVFLLSKQEVENYKKLICLLVDEETGELSGNTWTRTLYYRSNYVYCLDEDIHVFEMDNSYSRGVWPVINVSVK